MEITKDLFIRVLEILEEDCGIDNFQILQNSNGVRVCTENTDIDYFFNDNNILIDPRIQKLREQIAELEIQKSKLYNQLAILQRN